MNDGEVQERQYEVQRSLGRCLLRLQQYERLLKAIVAHHDLSGPAHALEKIRAARIDAASTKTLGILVGQFLQKSSGNPFQYSVCPIHSLAGIPARFSRTKLSAPGHCADSGKARSTAPPPS